MRGQPTDYLPCSIYFNPNLQADGFDCSSEEARIQLAEHLGTDSFVSTGIGHTIHPDVRTETWIEEPADSEFPVLWQAWDTPAGRLTQAVKMTHEWGKRSRIGWSDISASNLVKPLISAPRDVAAFRFLYQPLTDEAFAAGNASRQASRDLAERHQVPLLCTYGQGLALLLFTMGAENAIFFAVDHPAAFAELAQIIHDTELRNIELAKRAGVHVLKRFGGYEMTNFYNVDMFTEVVMPKLRKEVAFAHELDLLIYYRVVTGMTPLLDHIARVGFDCIEGGEPCLSDCSLGTWHNAFAGKAASWTGISTPVLLGGGDAEAVRREVRQAAETFADGGFILGVTNSIRNHFPWHTTLAMVDEWKRLR